MGKRSLVNWNPIRTCWVAYEAKTPSKSNTTYRVWWKRRAWLSLLSTEPFIDLPKQESSIFLLCLWHQTAASAGKEQAFTDWTDVPACKLMQRCANFTSGREVFNQNWPCKRLINFYNRFCYLPTCPPAHLPAKNIFFKKHPRETNKNVGK